MYTGYHVIDRLLQRYEYKSRKVNNKQTNKQTMFLLVLLALCCTGAWSQQYPQGYPQGHDVLFYFWSVSLNGRLSNGECCDFTNATICPASCDVHFVVCVREHNETSNLCNSITSSHITFFHYAYVDTNNVTFLEGDNVFGAGLHNPLDYSFSGNWSKHIQIVLVARDYELFTFNFSHIDYLVINWIIAGGTEVDKRSYNGAYNNMVVEVGLSVECWEGWYGEYCTIFCIDSDDSTGHFECDEKGEKTCLEGWTGVHCLTGVCHPACPVGSSCNATRVCECILGYREVGEECKCIPSPDCNPIGGFCQQPAECNCHTGYSGTNCYTIDYCLLRSNPCSNGGVCVPTGNDTYICGCASGYQGTHCEFMACPNTGCSASLPCGENGTCANTTTGVHCMCDGGYTGRCCDKLVNYCLNNPCAHGTCENKIGDYTCTCDPGYTGKDCDIPIDECSPHNPCRNRGECVDQIAGYKCVCNSNYTGTNCTVPCPQLELCQCESDCVYGGCSMIEDSYTCLCTPGHTGERCEEDIDDCSGACHNGAGCVDGLNSFHCHCTPGYTGVTCADDVDECSQSDPCEHGNCLNTDGSYSCSCEEAYTGTLCDTFQQLDYCARDDPCQNGGTCHDDAFSSRCECPMGYNGTLCEDQTNPCLDITCENSGTCGGGECVCPVSYTGPECSELVDVCEELVLPGACHGVCINDVTLTNGYLCECERGYTGDSCHEDIDDCVIGTCQNGGTCMDGLDEFFCDCLYGYAGERCEEELDTCETNQCMNGGTCVKEGTGYKCLCKEGEVNPVCQKIADCDRRSCSNKGECKGVSQDLKEAVCLCDSGYTGLYCDSLIDYCAEDPCDEWATCYRGVSSYYCRCDNNATDCVESGQPSAQLIPGVHNSVTGATGGAVLGAVGTLLCVTTLLLVFCGVRYKRKSVRRQARERGRNNDTFVNPTIYGIEGCPLIEPPSYDTLQLPHYLITPAAYPGLKIEKNECFQSAVCYENKILL